MNIKFIYFDLGDTLLYKQYLLETIQQTIFKYTFTRLDISEIRKQLTFLKESIVFPDNPDYVFYTMFNLKLLESLSITNNLLLISDELFVLCKRLNWAEFKDNYILNTINIPKGILSNWNKKINNDLLLLPYDFSIILGSEIEGIAKPNLAYYELAIKKTGLRPDEILYIGDSITLDLLPALNKGLNAYIIDRYGLYPFLKNRISSMQEILILL